MMDTFKIITIAVCLCANIMVVILGILTFKNSRLRLEILMENFKYGKGLTEFPCWVARDFDGRLFCYEERPERFDAILIWLGKGRFKMQLPMEMLPLLTWEDEPQKYNIKIYATKISEEYGTTKI